MKIKMNTTRPGSPSGYTVSLFEAGNVYEFTTPGGEAVARSFISSGFAEEVADAKMEKVPYENKSEGGPTDGSEVQQMREQPVQVQQQEKVERTRRK